MNGHGTNLEAYCDRLESFKQSDKEREALRPFLLLNAYDDRLDTDLPRMDPKAESRFAEQVKTGRKYCNSFHLTGKCEAAEFCDYVHGQKLSPGELLVLKHKARSRTCPERAYCRDVQCTYGHHCRMKGFCTFEDCWFSSTHKYDFVCAI